MLKYYLRSPEKEYTVLKLRCHYRGKRIECYPGSLKIPTKFWNTKTQRIHKTFDLGYLSLNQKLDQADYDLRAWIFNKEMAMEYPTVREVKQYILSLFLPKEHRQQDEFLDFVDQYVADRIASGKYAYFTTEKEQTFASKLRHFQQSIKNTITWKDINPNLFDRFEKWQIAQNLSNNYIGTNLKIFKRILRTPDAKKQLGKTSWLEEIRIKWSPVDAIYLTVNELKSLQSVDLSDNVRVDKVRDLFLVAAWTGVSFVDIPQVSNDIEVIAGKKLVHVRRTKSKIDAVIPLHATVQSIIDKYMGSLPSMPSLQKFNNYVKEACALAGISEVINTRRYSGSKIITTSKPKHELVSSHTARRSFATNAVLAGLPIDAIMKITGHKNVQTFMKYVRMDAKTSAMRMAGSDFFR